jgi:hypothetical protein
MLDLQAVWCCRVSGVSGTGSRRENNEGTDDDETTTKGGGETSDKHLEGGERRWCNRLWEEDGGAGGGVEDLVGKWATKPERAGLSAWCLAA